MTTAQWRPGTLYPTGSLCVPTNPQAGSDPAIPNYNFELGNQDWTTTSDPGSTTAIVNEPGYDGAWCVKHVGTGEDADGNVVGDTYYECIPGQNIPARCYGKITTGGNGASFSCVIFWYTAASVFISATPGSQVTKGSGTGWRQATVSAIAPPGAYKARIGASMNTSSGPTSTIYVDTFSWSYVSPAPAGLIYKAVQPTIGTSDAEEPVWPLTVGVQVTDGTVIWEAMIGTRVTYEASPILLSGETEPAWPESIGSFVTDNTISWEAVPQQVLQAPQSKVVTIASSKVYAADGDIVRYCATVNPLDWTSADDAGYLPTGLNQYGSNRTAVLNTYRGNVVPFSASTFLCYQADPDPANITQLDSMEGIGSTYQQAAHPVANDLFYLSPLGVRTVGIAAGTSNLAAGDAGAPIDPLVQAALIPAGIRPMAAYYPNQGQYWLMMRPPLPTVEGPTITGSAPDGVESVAYVGYAYTITPGDAAIDTVLITSGALPADVVMDNDGVLDTAVTIAPGDFPFELTATDLNGLQFTLPDQIVVVDALGNYWNPADTNGDITLTNGNRTATSLPAGTSYQKARGFTARSTGKWYFEVQGTFHPDNYDNGRVGLDSPANPLSAAVGQATNSYALQSNGYRQSNGVFNPTQMTPPLPGTNVIQVAWDADAGLLWYGVNNVWAFGGNPVSGTGESVSGVTGALLPACNMVAGEFAFNYTISTTPAQCSYTPPTGFSRWYP